MPLVIWFGGWEVIFHIPRASRSLVFCVFSLCCFSQSKEIQLLFIARLFRFLLRILLLGNGMNTWSPSCKLTSDSLGFLEASLVQTIRQYRNMKVLKFLNHCEVSSKLAIRKGKHTLTFKLNLEKPLHYNLQLTYSM